MKIFSAVNLNNSLRCLAALVLVQKKYKEHTLDANQYGGSLEFIFGDFSVCFEGDSNEVSIGKLDDQGEWLELDPDQFIKEIENQS